MVHPVFHVYPNEDDSLYIVRHARTYMYVNETLQKRSTMKSEEIS